MSAGSTNVPYNPYYDLETGVQQTSFCLSNATRILRTGTRE